MHMTKQKSLPQIFREAVECCRKEIDVIQGAANGLSATHKVMNLNGNATCQHP